MGYPASCPNRLRPAARATHWLPTGPPANSNPTLRYVPYPGMAAFTSSALRVTIRSGLSSRITELP